jgi:hypothetical protein
MRGIITKIITEKSESHDKLVKCNLLDNPKLLQLPSRMARAFLSSFLCYYQFLSHLIKITHNLGYCNLHPPSCAKLFFRHFCQTILYKNSF